MACSDEDPSAVTETRYVDVYHVLRGHNLARNCDVGIGNCPMADGKMILARASIISYICLQR